jgi:serine/threonine protein kinase
MAPGTKLVPYEILSQIGAGRMGEVCRARDAKLGRDVAIKVLPEAFARDTEHMAQFQREAKYSPRSRGATREVDSGRATES